MSDRHKPHQPAPGVPPIPPTIPDYELLRLIGSGSYGDVWLARSLTGHYRAVKIVWRNRFGELPPFEREFKGLREFAAVSLTEPQQLALLHVGRNQEAGYFYYVMELADDVERGRDVDPDRYTPHTLREARERHGRMPATQVVTLGVNLSRVLAGLHARGLVHRDIKPANVIFVSSTPKLADIGLVSVASTANTFVGTEGFVPPEGPGSPGADVYGLGKLLYEMATGLDRHDYPRLPPDLCTLHDHLDLLELNEILVKACEPNPTERYHDAKELLDDLLVLHAGRSMRRMRIAERRLSRAVRFAIALGIVATVVASGALIEMQQLSDEKTQRNVLELERDRLVQESVYHAHLVSVRQAMDRADFVGAERELLSLVPAVGKLDLRDAEWHHLLADTRQHTQK